MKSHFAILFVFFSICSQLNAQRNFQPGYIISNEGDIIKGFIDYRGDVLMGQLCSFRTTDESSITDYLPGQIKAYRFDDSKYYISKFVDGKDRFLEVLIQGKIEMYFYRDSLDHYYIDKEGLAFIEMPYNERVIYQNDIPYSFKSKTHIAILNQYMNDAPELQSAIASISAPKRSWLIKLAKEYHSSVCPTNECITFIRKVPFLKLNIEISGAVLFYYQDRIERGINATYLDLHGKKPFQLGIYTHLWLPNVNEKLYFKSGFVFINVPIGNGTHTIYQIPVQLEYIYPRGTIKPKIAGGINIHFPFYHSWAISAGADIKLSKSLYLGINWSPEFIGVSKKSDNVFFPNKLMLNGFHTGLTITL